MLPKRANGARLGATMNPPGSMDVSTPGPSLTRALGALASLPLSTKLAMVCLLFGWFFTKTLVVSLGSIEHGVRFFDMSAVIADPMRLFFGIETTLQRLVFGLLCLCCVFVPLAPRLMKERSAWLWSAAPFILIVVCAAALYSRTSGEFFTTPSDASSVTGSLIHLANDLARRTGDVVNRHLTIGGGAYLALIGSLVLLFQGLSGYRRQP